MVTHSFIEAPLVAINLAAPGLQFLWALVYATMGLALFGLAFLIIVKVSPFSIRKEIEEDQNTALGVIIGSVILGIALIIGAAVGG